MRPDADGACAGPLGPHARRTPAARAAVRLAMLALAGTLAAGCAQSPVNPASEPSGSPASRPPAPPPLTGFDGTWYWMGSLSPAGYASPDAPQRYTLTFARDGALSIVADCHRVRTRYALEGRTLELSPPAALKTPCPSGASTPAQFAAQLDDAGPARIADGLLELVAGTQTMVFSRRPDQRLAKFRCASGGEVVTLLSQDAALVRWRERSFRLTRVASPSGVRYRGDGAELSSRGPEAQLEVAGKPAAQGCTLARPAP